jgi:hypothetical protein
MVPMIAATKVRKKPNTEMFRILASTLPTKEPNTHQDIGEDAVVGLGHLLCDPSAIAPITSIDRKLTLGLPKKPCASSIALSTSPT